uniref:DUF7884 domain-containing protein n=1 Tax=Eutreptiella gymnastica TaxID=73025 RepID=A0A7S1NRL6_9EUGL
MLAAIWSVPGSQALEMPIQTVVQFYVNHHLLSTVSPRPLWRVVKGRSRAYVDAILKALPDVKAGTGIASAKRTDDGVVLTDIKGNQHKHDGVVFATHAPDTMRILGDDARAEEHEVLGAIRYQPNLCVLHDDPAFMPKSKKVWGAWNFIGAREAPTTQTAADAKSVCCTYWLNHLQNLPQDPHRFVTLNPVNPVPQSAILGQWTLEHPVLDTAAVAAQAKLPALQGKFRTWYAGAWTRYGFHEDGALSAVAVAQAMGAPLPWKATFTPDPIPSIGAWTAQKLFHHFAKSAIKVGQLRVILPDGGEQQYGPAGQALKATLRVLHWDFFKKLVAGSDIALGEAFMADLFDCDGQVAEFTDVLIANQNNFMEQLWMLGPLNYTADTLNWLQHRLLVRNTVELSAANIEAHYDQGNDMFRTFMDRSMMYSSAVHWDDDREEPEWLWGAKRDLELRTPSGDDMLYDAQIRKLDTILKAADIRPGATVLEIGCGWGECAIRGVTQYKCNWVGLTLSKEQKVEADERIRRLGLEGKIKILVVDYRNVFQHYPPGSFDCIVSIEMMEAIGHANFPIFFETVSRALKPGGKIAVQVITIPHSRYDAYCKSSDFIRKHIFPGGHLPSVTVLDDFSKKNNLTMIHCRDIGPHYSVTLREWCRRFSTQYDHIASLGYDREFIRKFIWYFAICESSFRAKMIGNHHLVWVKGVEAKEPLCAAPRSVFTRLREHLAWPEPTGLQSGLYTGIVYHGRRKVEGVSQAENSFKYPVMMAYLDLSELDKVFAGRWFWGVDRWAPISFNRADHYGPADRPLDQCLRDVVQKETGRRPRGAISMLTQLRFMGYCFNPITIYYCWNEAHTQVEVMVLHVTNTPWQEDICYVLPTQGKVDANGRFTTTFKKRLHVSPFLDMDYTYKLIAEKPGQRVAVQLQNMKISEDEKTKSTPFVASADLERRDVTTRSLLWFLLAVPLMTWQVQFWIHWQALILFGKKATVFEVDHPRYQFRGSAAARYALDLLKHLVLFAGALLWWLPSRIVRCVGL